MDAREKEIRRILTGIVAVEDGAVIAASDLNTLNFQGLYDGSLDARLFGLRVRRRQYRMHMKAGEMREACEKAFSELGRPVRLKTAPDALAVRCFPPMFKPCILTVEYEGRNVLLSFYASNSLFSFVNAARGLRSWERKMPKNQIEKTAVTIKPQLIVPEPANPPGETGNSGDKTKSRKWRNENGEKK